jgi:hypothetical protein
MAAGDLSIKYLSAQTVTITLQGLGSTSTRQSDVISNTSNRYIDYLVSVKLASTTGTIGGDRAAYVYALAADADGLADFTEGASTADSVITLTSPPNAVRIGYVSVPAANTAYRAGPFSIAAAFGGIAPARFAIAIENRSGLALSATTANFGVFVQPVGYNVQAS